MERNRQPRQPTFLWCYFYLCRLTNSSHCSQQPLPENTYLLFQTPRFFFHKQTKSYSQPGVPRGQQPRGQQTSYLVVNNQQPDNSVQLHFSIKPTKTFNPPSVVSITGEEIPYNISGLSSHWKYTVSHEVLADGQTSTIYNNCPASIHYLSSNHPAAKASSAACPGSSALITAQAAAAVDLVQLPHHETCDLF